MKIELKKVRENALMPTYGSPLAAGADLYACLDAPVTVLPGETVKIPTGIALSIPEHYAGFVYARSGLSTKMGLAPANKVGVIDADYRGEILVALYNQSKEERTVSPGERIAQLVIAPVERAEFCPVDTLSDTERGVGGFGSTGK